MMAANWQSAIERARERAPYLARGLDRLPELEALLAEGAGADALAFVNAAGSQEADIGVRLRREKQALALALAIGDLAGEFDLGTIVGELSSFADRALDAAIADAIRQRAPDAEPTGFSALALGKHGARELNYSSDIDPILLYDPETLPKRERDEPGEAAQRVARKVVQTLSEMTGEGYVFRVDLRLRPASEVSPLAISFNAAMTHYESSALAWERAAFIRARAASGDIAAGEKFLFAIRPFVWRRSLDFNALEDIRRLTTRIRDAHDGPRTPGPGFDLKKGRGGIREVEFFAQTHQLIHGGRNENLRLRGTRASLDALAVAGIIETSTAEELGESYDRLRTLEHRLQMIADQQTHTLPTDENALENVALLDGLASGEALVSELDAICEVVGGHFDTLLEDDTPGDGTIKVARGSSLASGLRKLQFSQPEKLAHRVEQWTDGRVRALRSEAARNAFEATAPAIFEALANAPDKDRAFNRFESLLSSLPSAVNFFRLLEARPGLLDQLVAILILAPTLSDELSRRPELLDTLIDKSAFDLPGDVDVLAKRMARKEPGDDYEKQLDRIRRIVGELRFISGFQLIESAHDPIDIARGLSRIAEAALRVSGDAAVNDFAEKHGRFGDGEIAVLGLGRLGGGLLTHASDLDIVFLFSNSATGESDGDRPLGATLYFNRLAQRMTGALSVPTAEGALYEVDTRLRPQGNQGPLAVSFEAFAKYQREDAWTWEHMALCRARPVYGSQKARAEIQQTVDEVLAIEREPQQLRTDLLKMRGEMAQHKVPGGPLDAKLLRGGLVDCEFLIHFLQLRDHKGLEPDLHEAAEQLVAAGSLSAEFPAAHDLMTRILVTARAFAPDGQIPVPSAQKVMAQDCGAENMDDLLENFHAARQVVARAWHEYFAEELELSE